MDAIPGKFIGISNKTTVDYKTFRVTMAFLSLYPNSDSCLTQIFVILILDLNFKICSL